MSIERWREPVSALPTSEQLRARFDEGWRPVAVEWERGREGANESLSGSRPIPYGLRISADCRHLEVDPVERDVIATIVALIAGDRSLSQIAEELNRRGLRSRSGEAWTQVALFRLLPRVIEVGPEILSREEWPAQKERLLKAVG